MAIKTYTLKETDKLTEEQIKEIKEAAKTPIVFDEDCPELTDEELLKFRRISDIRKEERRKQTVTLRISQKSLRKAKSLGKGYTAVLSRILENALNDDELIKRNL